MIILILGEDTTQMEEHLFNINCKRRKLFPETQLHPKKIVEEMAIYVSTYQSNEIDIAILTHSETIVNYLGHLIADNKLDKNAVEIHIVEIDEIRKCTYDNEGFILNWPFGFFDWKN